VASPAEVLRAMMIEAGFASMPATTLLPGQKAPCYVASLPDEADYGYLIKDTAPRMFGRAMVGTTWKHYGLKLNYRHLARDGQKGYDAIRALSDWMDDVIGPLSVNCRGFVCKVMSLYKTTDISEIGEEKGGTERRRWAMDLCLAMQSVEQTPIEE
jgi:hypothetical protein